MNDIFKKFDPSNKPNIEQKLLGSQTKCLLVTHIGRVKGSFWESFLIEVLLKLFFCAGYTASNHNSYIKLLV